MDNRLDELDNTGVTPTFQFKVSLILTYLKEQNYDVFIASGARTLEEQRIKVTQGFSKTLKSKHVITIARPKARAADIVPKSSGWNAPRRYWLMLCAKATELNLKSGAFFGLDKKQRAALHRAIALKDWESSCKIGWDPAHVETIEVEK